MKNAFDSILENTKPENKIFVDLNLDIRGQVLYMLSNHPTIKSQKDLSIALNKKESEVSRLLSGLHNLTLETIAKISAVLEGDIILTDEKAKKKYDRQEYQITSFSVSDSFSNFETKVAVRGKGSSNKSPKKEASSKYIIEYR